MICQEVMKMVRDNNRNSRGQFVRGNKCNTGGHFGGRKKILSLFDKICGDENNLKRLEIELQKAFDTDPLEFYRTYVFPLLPTKMIHEHENPNAELAATIQAVMFEHYHGNSEDGVQEN